MSTLPSMADAPALVSGSLNFCPGLQLQATPGHIMEPICWTRLAPPPQSGGRREGPTTDSNQ
eukprot:2400299-Lingulodinium_polyedra.AAC.1